jgi:hypothetical protein
VETGWVPGLSGDTVDDVVWWVRVLLKPFGLLAFLLGLLALSAAGRILGERDDLGFFSGRLARMVWRYPEIPRAGVQVAWIVWAALFALAVSPLDPIASSWDEVALGALAVVLLWRRIAGARRAGR